MRDMMSCPADRTIGEYYGLTDSLYNCELLYSSPMNTFVNSTEIRASIPSSIRESFAHLYVTSMGIASTGVTPAMFVKSSGQQYCRNVTSTFITTKSQGTSVTVKSVQSGNLTVGMTLRDYYVKVSATTTQASYSVVLDSKTYSNATDAVVGSTLISIPAEAFPGGTLITGISGNILTLSQAAFISSPVTLIIAADIHIVKCSPVFPVLTRAATSSNKYGNTTVPGGYSQQTCVFNAVPVDSSGAIIKPNTTLTVQIPNCYAQICDPQYRDKYLDLGAFSRYSTVFNVTKAGELTAEESKLGVRFYFVPKVAMAI